MNPVTYNVALWDMDGTLADDSHRKEHYLAQDWGQYFSFKNIIADPLLTPARLLIAQQMLAHTRVFIVTARREQNRKATEHWLEKHKLHENIPVFMRAKNDSRSPSEFKVSAVEYFLAQPEVGNIEFYENDDSVVEALNAQFGGNPRVSVIQPEWAIR